MEILIRSLKIVVNLLRIINTSWHRRYGPVDLCHGELIQKLLMQFMLNLLHDFDIIFPGHNRTHLVLSIFLHPFQKHTIIQNFNFGIQILISQVIAGARWGEDFV